MFVGIALKVVAVESYVGGMLAAMISSILKLSAKRSKGDKVCESSQCNFVDIIECQMTGTPKAPTKYHGFFRRRG